MTGDEPVVADPARPEPVDDAALRDAIAVANIPVLVMVLHHLSGDDRWLAEPYAPTRARGLSDHDTGGLPEPVQAEIREAAEHAVREWSRGTPPALAQPSPKQLQHLLSVCVAEGVPAEYARLMLVEMGFEPDATPTVDLRAADQDGEVLIVGAGVSGWPSPCAWTRPGSATRSSRRTTTWAAPGWRTATRAPASTRPATCTPCRSSPGAGRPTTASATRSSPT